MTPEGDLTLGASGAVTTFVCAAVDYDLDVAEPLMGQLPAVVHVPADPVGARDVAAIAREVGYASEYAFNRAFARHRGEPPGRYRRLARAGSGEEVPGG